jgi:two-component system alkaline phosphatase synthesis response regulator PhoP
LATSTQRILIVDENRTTRLLVQAYLVGRGFEFLEASNWEEARSFFDGRAADRAKPTLVLSDVSETSPDAFALVRAVRSHEDPGVRRTPIILAAARPTELLAKRSLEAGANAFLKKPLATSKLASTIEGLLNSARAA